jgi:drug/metabolite transporter (DMT)-like permease
MATRIEAAPHMRAREFWLLLLLSLVWGCSFFFLKILLREYPPLTVVLVRLALAALMLHLLLIAARTPFRCTAAQWRDFLILGALNKAIPFTLITWSETRITSGLAAILNAATPLFTVVVSHYLARTERLTWNRAIGVLIGFAGVATLLGPQLGDAAVGAQMPAEAACLLAAFVYAFAANFGWRFRSMSPSFVATGQLTASSVLMIPLVLLFDHPWALPLPSQTAIASFVGLAALSSAAGYVLFFRILAVAGATNILLVTLLMPVTALLLGTAIIHEPIATESILGMAIIACGLAVLDGRLPGKMHALATRRRRARPSPAAAGDGADGRFEFEFKHKERDAFARAIDQEAEPHERRRK